MEKNIIQINKDNKSFNVNYQFGQKYGFQLLNNIKNISVTNLNGKTSPEIKQYQNASQNITSNFTQYIVNIVGNYEPYKQWNEDKQIYQYTTDSELIKYSQMKLDYNKYNKTSLSELIKYSQNIITQKIKQYNIQDNWWYKYYKQNKDNTNNGRSNSSSWFTYYMKQYAKDAEWMSRGFMDDYNMAWIFPTKMLLMRALNPYTYTKIWNPLSVVKIPLLTSNYGWIPFVFLKQLSKSLLPQLPEITQYFSYYQTSLKQVNEEFQLNRNINNQNYLDRQTDKIKQAFQSSLALKMKGLNDILIFKPEQKNQTFWKARNTRPLQIIQMENADYQNSSPSQRIENNYIDFQIYDVNNKKILLFPALINNLSDESQPTYQKIQNTSTMIPTPLYTGNSGRTITFNLSLVCQGRWQLKQYVSQLNHLMGLRYPSFKEINISNDITVKVPKAPLIRVTLGDLLRKTFGYFENISIQWQEEFSWQIQRYINEENSETRTPSLYDSVQIPLITTVSFTFFVLYDKQPQTMGKHIFGMPQDWIN